MHLGVKQSNYGCCKVVVLLGIGFIAGLLLNQYGFLFENIRVNVKITVIEDDHLGSIDRHLLPGQQTSDVQMSYVVPNVVHFIWFTDDDAGKRMMTFVDYMSILSVYRIQQPDEIQFHCSRLPDVEDVWWARLWREIPIRIVYFEKSALLGQLHASTAHKQFCKLMAIKVLIENGGIFIDWNVLVVKKLDPLRQHNLTLGKVSASSLSTDVVAARRNDTFLRILVDSHESDVEPCDVDSSAYRLSLKHPDLLNTVPFLGPSITSDPSGRLTSDLAMPFVMRLPQNRRALWRESSPESIKSVNGTIAAAMRYIYYGSE